MSTCSTSSRGRTPILTWRPSPRGPGPPSPTPPCPPGPPPSARSWRHALRRGRSSIRSSAAGPRPQSPFGWDDPPSASTRPRPPCGSARGASGVSSGARGPGDGRPRPPGPGEASDPGPSGEEGLRSTARESIKPGAPPRDVRFPDFGLLHYFEGHETAKNSISFSDMLPFHLKGFERDLGDLDLSHSTGIGSPEL